MRPLLSTERYSHVVPLGDILEHEVDHTCHCGYVMVDEKEVLLVHRSYDLRELFEDCTPQ